MELGRLGKPWGLKGFTHFHPYNVNSVVLEAGLSVLLGKEGKLRRVGVAAVMKAAGKVVVRLSGVDSPEGARALTGQSLFVPRSSLPPTDPNEFYVHDLVGCRVMDADGKELGMCTDVFPTGSNDVLVVGQGREEILVALHDQFVEEVNLQSRWIRLKRWEEI